MFVPQELKIQDWSSGAMAVGPCRRLLPVAVAVAHLAKSAFIFLEHTVPVEHVSCLCAASDLVSVHIRTACMC